MTESNNKTIAKNTVLLYIRMVFTMLIGLYTSRVVLQMLGVVDYGVYNVVGGIVGMLSFLNSTMSSATSRFLTYELGLNNEKKLNETFNAAIIIHLVIAIIVVLIADTVGLWFLYNKLVIPSDRMVAAFWVLQFSIISSFLGITQVPYNACIIAHEKMDVFAFMQILGSVLKLGIVYMLTIVNYDKLITYSFLLLIVSLLIMMIYRVYAIRHFKECHFRFKISKEIIRPMISFSGWDLFGHFGYTFRYQGTNMVLNLFFGPIVNAASGITATVQGVLIQFSNNITLAVKPQIIKRYASGDIQSMVNLLNKSLRLNLFMILLVTIPTSIEIPLLLSLWLTDVPDYCVSFCRIALWANVISSYSQLVYAGLQATGDLKKTSINRNIIYVSTPIVLYFVYHYNSSAPILAYIFLIVGQFMQSILDVSILKQKVKALKISELLVDIVKMSVIGISVYWMCLIIANHIHTEMVGLIIVYLMSSISLLVSFYYIIFKLEEKLYIKNLIMKRIYGKHHS